MRLFDAAAMREADARAIHSLGIPGPVLMESAGRGALTALVDAFGDEARLGVTVLTGRGNNGGDGHVVARYLHDRGYPVTLVLLFDPETCDGDAALYLGVARRCGVVIEEIRDLDAWEREGARLLSVGVVVEGILGTGLSSPVRGLYRRVIEDLNASDTPVLCLDLPAGLCASTGQVLGVAVRADRTVTFGGMKLGLAITPGCEYAGDVEVVDIGIPSSITDPLASGTWVDREAVAHRLPPRPMTGHKGTFGHLLVVAGGAGKVGAAILTAGAALRAGAGLVTLALPEGCAGGGMAIPPEIMVEAVAADGGGLSAAAIPRLRALARGKQAIAAGPGLGTSAAILEVMRALVHLGIPMVIDADGLNVLDDETLATFAGIPAILTPHPGELGRLLGLTSAEIQADRIAAARGLAERSGAVTLLKGARTLTVPPDGRIFVNATGNPGMGSGGCGDALTGLIGGLMAQGCTPLDAGVAGAWIHGLAGDLAAAERGARAIVATDLIERFGQAMARAEGEGHGDER